MTTNTLQISTDYQLKNANANIYNTTGQLVAKQKINGTGLIQITLPSLAKGLYYLQVSNNGIIEKRKFVLN
ncbi:MAG: T9SS type A sorting domain-containing protein [Chitinophagaceae bacterium]|nr:T9SS type A sorting domain-containing protein [Chitinophagaceae bacterium]MBL0254921.1 T9SS type A sorting domain-containing protein [Chitinophagaceae bacterium]